MKYYAAIEKSILDLYQFTWKDFHGKLLMKIAIYGIKTKSTPPQKALNINLSMYILIFVYDYISIVIVKCAYPGFQPDWMK